MNNLTEKKIDADAESQFNANFIRKGTRRKCMYFHDKEAFLAKLNTITTSL